MMTAFGCEDKNRTPVPEDRICPECGRLESHAHKKILFLALGIGRVTPEFIKIPFINMTYSLPDARLVLVNKGEPEPLAEIADKTIALDADILETLHMMMEMKKEAVSCA